jgi:hypothetical protein
MMVGERAKILNTEVIRDVKVAMVELADTVGAILAGVDSEIARISQWLNQEQIGHWKREVRRREDDITQRKAEIARKRFIAAPEPASVVAEQKALRKAEAQLDQAQRKLAAVRKWAPIWEREALLYKTATSGLTESLARDVPAAVARLERMLASLDEYTRLAVPQTNSAGVEEVAQDLVKEKEEE